MKSYLWGASIVWAAIWIGTAVVPATLGRSGDLTGRR